MSRPGPSHEETRLGAPRAKALPPVRVDPAARAIGQAADDLVDAVRREVEAGRAFEPLIAALDAFEKAARGLR